MKTSQALQTEQSDRRIAHLVEEAVDHSSSKSRADRSQLFKIANRFGAMGVEDITTLMIEDWVRERLELKAASATIIRELAMFKKLMNQAVDLGLRPSNPVSKVVFKLRPNWRERWLSSAEEIRLIESCPEWLSRIVRFTINTGLRRGEVLSLSWHDIDLERRAFVILKSKNGEKRGIPMNAAAFEIIRECFDQAAAPSGPVFPKPDGHQVDVNHLEYSFRKAVKAADLSDLHFHDLRHSFATRLAQAGVDMYRIQRLLGHKSPIMTQRYAHHSVESLRECVEMASARPSTETLPLSG